jgi:hypothetical protein
VSFAAVAARLIRRKLTPIPPELTILPAFVALVAGLLLLDDRIGGKAGTRIVGALRPFEVVIGIVALILGVLNLLSILGITLVLAGLVLSVSSLRTVPRVGDDLARAGTAVGRYRNIIGVVALIIAILTLLRILA